MADGDTSGYDFLIRVASIGMINDYFQVFHTRQVEMMFIGAFSFRKVCLFIPPWNDLSLIIRPKRIYDGSQRMVRRFIIYITFILRRFTARAIFHDPEIYPDPEEFKPERFLNEDGTVRDDPTLTLVFGVGRRICPGRHFADATLFIVTSSVLSVFTVTKAKEVNGHDIPVKAAVTVLSGIVV
jgi:hypothetical protein